MSNSTSADTQLFATVHKFRETRTLDWYQQRHYRCNLFFRCRWVYLRTKFVEQNQDIIGRASRLRIQTSQRKCREHLTRRGTRNYRITCVTSRPRRRHTAAEFSAKAREFVENMSEFLIFQKRLLRSAIAFGVPWIIFVLRPKMPLWLLPLLFYSAFVALFSVLSVEHRSMLGEMASFIIWSSTPIS